MRNDGATVAVAGSEFRVRYWDDGPGAALQLFHPFGNATMWVTDPDELRSLAAMLIEQAQFLQDRIDVAEGIGGDQ